MKAEKETEKSFNPESTENYHDQILQGCKMTRLPGGVDHRPGYISIEQALY